MLNQDRRNYIETWFRQNGIPKTKWEYIIKTLNNYDLTFTDKTETEDILRKYKRVKNSTEKLQHEINLLSGEALEELNILLENNILHEQYRLKENDPTNRLPPRHLGDIDISLYLSSLLLTCENIQKVKNNTNEKKVYESLLWLCRSLDEQFNFVITKRKAIDFISSCIGKSPDTVRKQLNRLLKIHKWDYF